MIVKNEEHNLPRALRSAAGLGAELVVIDTGSTDRTADVATQAGARVVPFAWTNDFSAARNFAFAQARGRWLLVLDADEELGAELRDGIGAVLADLEAEAVRLPVSDLDDLGRERMRVPSVRMVRAGRGYAYEGRVHEDIEGSVRRAGGAIVDIALPILHRGYTAAESARKNRHQRNLELVQAAHRADPSNPRHWHYLGLQLGMQGDRHDAARWFERVLREAPEHPLAGWSASQLAQIRFQERSFGAAWAAAHTGARPGLGHIPSLARLAEIAVREADGPTALAAATALAELPPGVEGDFARRTVTALVLRARGTALVRGPAQAYAELLDATWTHPGDALLADELMKMAERAKGTNEAILVAVRDSEGAPAVTAAAIGALLRQGAAAHAVELGASHRVCNEYFAHALLRVGRHQEAKEIFERFGESAARHLLLLGLERNCEATLAAALAMLPPRAADTAACIVAQRQVPKELRWMILEWMELALSHRADELALRLSQVLPGSPSDQRGTLALLLFESRRPGDALHAALTCPSTVDSMEVLGLVSHETGDTQAAAHFLSARAQAPDCPVRVTLAGTAALRAVGDEAGAKRVLTLGRQSRPHAEALAA
jgi:hypothetical protein